MNYDVLIFYISIMVNEPSDSQYLATPSDQAFEALINARMAPLLDYKDILEWEGLVLVDPDLNIEYDAPFLPEELRRYVVDLANYVKAVANWAEERLIAQNERGREIEAVNTQIKEIDSELSMYEGIRSDVKRTLAMIKQLKDMGEDVTYLDAALSEIMNRLSYASEDEGDGQSFDLPADTETVEASAEGLEEAGNEVTIVFPDGSTSVMKTVKATKLIQIFLSQDSWSAEDLIALRESMGLKESTFTFYVSTVRKVLEPLGWTLSPYFAKSGGSVIRYGKESASRNHTGRSTTSRAYVEPLANSGQSYTDEPDSSEDSIYDAYESLAESGFTREELMNVQAILYNLTCYIVDSAVRTTAPIEAIQQLGKLRADMPDRLKAVLLRNAFNALVLRQQIERSGLSRDFNDIFRFAINHLRYNYPHVPLSDKSLLLFQVFKLLKLNNEDIEGVV